MHDEEATAPLSRAHLEQVMQQRAERPQVVIPPAAPLVAPSAPTAPNMAVPPQVAPRPQLNATPYPYHHIPTISASQVALGNKLLRMLPASHTSEQPVITSICEVLESLTGLKHELHFHGVRVLPGPAQLPELGQVFLTRFSLPPDPEFGLLSCELSLVESWLRGLLGELEAPGVRMGPLNEQDFGATTYIALRILERLCHAHGLAPLTLASSPPSLASAKQHMAMGPDVVEVAFVLSSEVTAGAVRLWVPAHLVQSLEVFAQGELVQGRLARRLWRSGLGLLACPLTVSVGRVALTPIELLRLGAGDVLLPEHGLALDGLDGAHQGGRLYFDPSLRGAYVPITLTPETELHRWQLKVDQITPHHANKEMMMTQGTDAQKTQALVDEGRVEVELRMGSVSMSFRQLAELQPGHVMALEQALHSPVELVAQGRVVGTAELVNVEGRLGARVLTLRS